MQESSTAEVVSAPSILDNIRRKVTAMYKLVENDKWRGWNDENTVESKKGDIMRHIRYLRDQSLSRHWPAVKLESTQRFVMIEKVTIDPSKGGTYDQNDVAYLPIVGGRKGSILGPKTLVALTDSGDQITIITPITPKHQRVGLLTNQPVGNLMMETSWEKYANGKTYGRSKFGDNLPEQIPLLPDKGTNTLNPNASSSKNEDLVRNGFIPLAENQFLRATLVSNMDSRLDEIHDSMCGYRS